MKIIKTLYAYIYLLDRNDFYKNIAIFIGVNILTFVLFMLILSSNFSSYSNALQEMYKREEETKKLLERLTNVKKQSEEINNLLKQEPSFRIKNFFDDALKKLNLTRYQKRDADVTEEDVLKGKYTEVRLNSLIYGIDTRQLCDLLQTLEEKSRIYMKELVITKKGSFIDVNITIATLTADIDGEKTN